MTEATDGVDLIVVAIIDAFGERCPEYEAGCPCCDVWKQYDDYVAMRSYPGFLAQEVQG